MTVEYDKELRKYLVENNICVIVSVDFSLKNWLAITDIIDRCVLMKNDDLVLGGISSGAMIAHHVANVLHLPALLICQVIRPADRHLSLPDDLQKKQLNFFGSMEYMQNIQDSVKEPNECRYILYGKKDNRAPIGAYESWLIMGKVVSDGLDQGHEICNNPPCELIARRLIALFQSC